MKMCAAVVAFVAITVIGAAAQTTTVSLQAHQMPIRDAMEAISKQAGVQVICEPGVKGEVTGSFSAMDIERFLDTVTAGGTIVWRKVYLPSDPEKKPTVEQIKAQMDAVRRVGDTPIIVYDPATKTQTVYVKQIPEQAKITPESLGLKPVYLISELRPEAKATAEGVPQGADVAKDVDPGVRSEFMSLQTQRIGILNALPPEQRVQLIQQEMINEMSMAPASLADVLKAQWDARRNMPQELRDQYRQTMREARRIVRQQSGDTGAGRPGGRNNRQGRGN